MKTVGILVDFDNIFPRTIGEYTETDIREILVLVINSVRVKLPDVERFIIRLYGGWYTNSSLTTRASTLSTMLPALNTLFPILTPPSYIIQGNIEMATQLYGHSFVWYNTYREHAGLPKLRIDHSVMGAQCGANTSTCPVLILKKFTERKQRVCDTAGCTTEHSSVFFQRTQKYVDTMIACDIISFGTDNEVIGVFVLSDDVDHFPAFAVAHDLRTTQAKLGLFIINEQNVTPYKSFLSPFEVDVTLIQ